MADTSTEKFDGWMLVGGISKSFDTDIPGGTDHDVEFEAVWSTKQITYTVVFNYPNSNSSDSYSLVKDSGTKTYTPAPSMSSEWTCYNYGIKLSTGQVIEDAVESYVTSDNMTFYFDEY